MERRIYPETTVRIEYVLTEKGHDLEGVVRELSRWAEYWLPPSRRTQRPARSLVGGTKLPPPACSTPPSGDASVNVRSLGGEHTASGLAFSVDRGLSRPGDVRYGFAAGR